MNGERLSLQVSSLYDRGAPLNEVEHVFEITTERGHFDFMVIPGHESITVITSWREPGAPRDESQRSERDTPLIWQPWGYGERPYVVCWCGNRVSRAFITTERPAHGMLVCRRCAGSRYESQDGDAVSRLEAKSDGLRVRLRSGSGAYDPVPEKPPRMHWSTYRKLSSELEAIEEKLARHREAEREALAKIMKRNYPALQTATNLLEQIEERNKGRR